MKRTLSALGVGLALLVGVAACAQTGGQAGSPGRTAALRLTAEPLGAALVTPRFGWVLTINQLLLTTDGGASFQPASVNVPATPARAAYFADANHGWVASATGTEITVSRTADGGSTWKTLSLKGTDEVGSLSISFAGDNRGALLAGRQTSSNFSMATLYATADGGGSWTPVAAPVNGTVTADASGNVWVAGGVFGNQLYATSDAGRTWTAQKLDVASGSVESVATPSHGVVAATVVDGSATRIATLTAATGGAWTENASVAVPADPGVAPATAGYDSTAIMVDPSGKRLYRGSDASRQLSSVVASGLPAGASQASFVDPNTGWVLAASGTCAAAKTACTYTTQVTATADGGKSWRAVATYQQ
jgi:hypothetical protein